MKKGIHPKYYPEAKVICSCGNTFTTGSTQELIRTDVCSACHPFFTGEQRIVDTAGQVERFMKRLEKKEELAVEGQTHPEEVGGDAAKAVKAPKKLDEAEAARAVTEKLRGKKAAAERVSPAASARPAEVSASGRPGRKKAVRQGAAVSEGGPAAD